MCQLLETIKCYNGELYNLSWHNKRFNRARKEMFNEFDKIDLGEIITIPEKYKKGLFRCRVVYSKTIDKIEFIAHQFRKIESLKLIEDNNIDYQYKYSDRNDLNKLFEKRGDCDDILIVKNGFITDSLTANVIFFDGKKWWTSETPLLPGTQRAKLIYEGKIFPCSIPKKDVSKYLKAGLINTLQNLESMPVILTTNIK